MNALKCLSCTMLLVAAGCQGFQMPTPDWQMPSFGWPDFDLRSQTPDKDDYDDYETKVETPMVGDYTRVTGLNLITIKGVGLVTGLSGTGGDPPPSPHRTALLEDMKRHGVYHPNRLLKDRSTALVIVTAHLPPLVRKGDRFDVEVRLAINSDATSLSGGWLMETHLTEQAIVPGQRLLKGHVFAKAKGPIMIAVGDDKNEPVPAMLKRGRVLGGGVSRRDRDMALYLRSDFKSVRNSDRIARRIGMRFFGYDKHGMREPLAEAKTDRKITLKILKTYKDNFPRYLQVIRSIAFREDEVAQRVRMQKLKKQLNNPPTSERAAVQLEAIGIKAVPFLKSGLENPSFEVQFHAAVALAYLGESDGLSVLAQAVHDEPAFRVFALVAMSVIDDAESVMLLKQLLNERSAETRYGAFRALTTMNKNDPDVVGENLDNQFRLHVMNTTGPPLIHLTTRKKAELVLFGADQRFEVPIAVRAGRHIQITAQPGSDTIIVSRYQLGKKDRREEVSTRVADVIRVAVDLGASYPDVSGMIFEAAKQNALQSRLDIDALPETGRVYHRPAVGDSNVSKSNSRVGSSNMNLAPNLFDQGKRQRAPYGGDPTGDLDATLTEEDDDKNSEDGQAALVDVRDPQSNDRAEDPLLQKWKQGLRYLGFSKKWVEPDEGE